MSNTINYNDLWAPYWSYIEDNYLDTESINKLAPIVKSPVLVVGAGQGIIVEQLTKMGLKVDGIDFSPEMIKYAKQRRGIDLIQADARSMPFEDNAYQSTIIVTGVVDFMDDEGQIALITNEVKRVTNNPGEVLVAFYRLHPRVEELMRYIGTMSDDRWYFKRQYELFSLQPGDLITELKKMPQVSTLGAMLALIKSQVMLPKKEKLAAKNWQKAWEKAQQEMEKPRRLIECAPESFPYRDEQQIRGLFSNLNVSLNHIHVLYSCIVAQLTIE
jgi:ubiquinone/menaquinone biosynthesis C-methylase UbiE